MQLSAKAFAEGLPGNATILRSISLAARGDE